MNFEQITFKQWIPKTNHGETAIEFCYIAITNALAAVPVHLHTQIPFLSPILLPHRHCPDFSVDIVVHNHIVPVDDQIVHLVMRGKISLIRDYK